MTASPGGLLDGIRVVAIEQAVAGPLCTRHLADLGADVIKIERPGFGDSSRQYDSLVGGFSTHFVWLNRGKRSIAVDLKREEGVDVLCSLLRTADVFVTNLGPGAMSRLLGRHQLAALNPRLVNCVISGYGPDGPYSNRKAYDLIIQGEAGVTRSTGTPDMPAKPGVSLADLSAGVYALAAITSALVERGRTGRGRNIEISLFDTVAEWMTPLLLAQLYSGTTPPPSGMRHSTICPYGPFETADGFMVNVAIHTEAQWRRLCLDVLRDEELFDDPDYNTNERRFHRRDAVEARVGERLRHYSFPDLQSALDSADIPWGRLNSVSEVVVHPQLMERNRWIKAHLPDGAEVDVLAHPFLLSELPSSGSRIPSVGEHTVEILKEIGYKASDVEKLQDLGVFLP